MEQTINSNEITLYEPCACECGGLTRSPKATFIPGHDAKLVSKLARRMYVAYRDGDQVAEFGLWQKARAFSPALQGKLHGAFRLAKVRGGRVRSQGRSIPETVKIGRWEYPTKLSNRGQVFRNTKRDGSGEWIFHEKGKVA